MTEKEKISPPPPEGALGSGENWSDWVRNRWAAGRLDDAEYGLRQQLQREPESALLHALLGRVLFDQKQFDASRSELEAVMNRAQGPLLQEILRLWGRCVLTASQVQPAFDPVPVLLAKLPLVETETTTLSTSPLPDFILQDTENGTIGWMGTLREAALEHIGDRSPQSVISIPDAPQRPCWRIVVVALSSPPEPRDSLCRLVYSATQSLQPNGRLIALLPQAMDTAQTASAGSGAATVHSMARLLRSWLELLGLEFLAFAPASWDEDAPVLVACNRQEVPGHLLSSNFSAYSADSETPSSHPPAPLLERGVIYRGTVYNGTGYSDTNIGMLLNFHRIGLPMELRPIGPQSDRQQLLNPEIRAVLDELQRQQVNRSNAVLFHCCPTHDIDGSISARYQIGRATFETDRLPENWLPLLEQMDEIWVPSSFNREVFTACGIPEEKLWVTLEGLDTALYTGDVQPIHLPMARNFRFLSIFDWHCRKAPEILLRAYLSEFKGDEDVTLVLKLLQFNNASIAPEARITQFIERDMGMRIEDAPPIVVLSGVIPAREIPRLYASANAFVLPTRGEGWGRPFTEALASACPVIATRWSGHLDFLHDGNSYLIDIEGVVPAAPDIDAEIFAGHRWAEPSVDHLRQLMRHVFTHRDEARRRAALGQQEMISNFDWKVLSQKWADRLFELVGS